MTSEGVPTGNHERGANRWERVVGPLAVFAPAIGLFLRDIAGRDVFSWMDPWQYFGMGRALAEGAVPEGGFEVPTIFPWFIAPLLAMDVSVETALLTNLGFLLVILLGTMWLVRELGIERELPFASTAAGLLLLASPLLYGLSRELYSETALTAVVTLAFGFWLRWLRIGGLPSLAGLAVFAGLAVAIKITAPLFFIGPFLGVTIWLASKKRFTDWLWLCAAFAIGFGIALAGLWFAIPNARPYFLSLGNTEIPIMHLIGPPVWWSPISIIYYPWIMVFPMLGLLALLLILAVIRLVRDGRAFRLPFPIVVLWLWLVTPAVILIVQETKEPRHILPCLVPAVLLILDGVWARLRHFSGSQFRVAAAKWAAVGVLLVFASLLHIQLRPQDIPYYFPGGTEYPALITTLLEETPVNVADEVASPPPTALWAYRRNFVMAGMEPDEALALAWLLRPGIVANLENNADEVFLLENMAGYRYEDPFLYSVFETYNRRIGFRNLWSAVGFSETLDYADIIFIGPRQTYAAEKLAKWVEQQVVFFETKIGRIRVIVFPPAPETYRRMYNEFLLDRFAEKAKEPGEAPEDPEKLEDLATLRAIRRDMMTEFLLTTDGATLENPDKRARLWGLPEEYPALFKPDGLEEIVAARPIYWFGVYGQINQWRRERLEAFVPASGLIRDNTRERIDNFYEDPLPVVETSPTDSTTGL